MATFPTWYTEKTSPTTDDKILIADAASSNQTKYSQIWNLPFHSTFVTVWMSDADYICDWVDDHLQIQEAVDALSTENGGSWGTIFIKDWTYSIGRRIVILSSDITIRGNWMSTKLVLAPNVDQEIFVVGNWNANDPDVDDPLTSPHNFIPYVAYGQVVACNNVNFYDFYMDGNQQNQYQWTFSDIRYGISATRNLIRYRSDALTSYGADINNVFAYNWIQNWISIESHKLVTTKHIRCEDNLIFGIWWESGWRWNFWPWIYTRNNWQNGIKIYGSGMCNISGWVSEKDQWWISIHLSDRVQVSNFIIRDAWYNSAAKSAITLSSTVSETSFCNGNIQNTWGDAIEIYGNGDGWYNKFDNITIKGTGQLTTNTYSDIHFKSGWSGRSTNNRFSKISCTSTTANVPKYWITDDTGWHTWNHFIECQFVAPYWTWVNWMTSIDNQFINCTGINGVSTKTANYTIKYSDNTVLVDASWGAVTIYMPVTLLSDIPLTVKKIDSSANAVTVHWNGVNIDGSASKTITTQYNSITVVSNWTQWYERIWNNKSIVGITWSTTEFNNALTGDDFAYLAADNTFTGTWNTTFAGKVWLGITPVSRVHTYENSSEISTWNWLTIEQAWTWDAKLQFLITGTTRWSVWADNSDSDKFKIGSNADLWTSLFEMDTAWKIWIWTTASSSVKMLFPAWSTTVAPLRLTAWTNLTTAVNWTFEYDGTNLYFTTWGTRKTVTLV